MEIKNYPFQKLPFSDLFKTYIDNFSRIADFYAIDPFDPEAVKDKAAHISCSFNRSRIAELLTEFNRRFDVTEATLKNIRRLENNRALAVVTGQQLGVYGGPVYTIYKTLSAVHLSRHLEAQLDRPVIPVFWLADEDHDYEEVNSTALPDRDEVQKVHLPKLHNRRPPVSELTLPEELEQFREQIRDLLPDTDFSDELWKLLDSCFKPFIRFDQAFGNFISRLFSKHGLVLAGSNTEPIKELTGGCLKKAVTAADKIRAALDRQSQNIKKDFHQQVTLYDSNLFYLGESGRVKIARNGKHWKTDTGRQWKTEELLDEIDRHPEHFSPNVFLRPMLQEKVLPTLGYVAGPGETAYYGQMKAMYHLFDLTMPAVFPRLSATIVEPAIERILEELPFELYEYSDRIEDLEAAYVNRTEQIDIEAVFKEWKNSVEKTAAPATEKIKAVDPTLEGTAGKATAVYFGELDKLKGKVYRSVKQQEQTQLNRIRKIKTQLFPAGGLQERNIAGIYYMNKYGVDIWDRILEQMDEDDLLSEHKLIYV